MLIEWTESLSVHIDEIDIQHKKLVALLNGLHEAIIGNRQADCLSGLFDELLKYAAEHFDSEEKLMEQHGFPGLQAHRAEHEKFVMQVVGFKGIQGFDFYAPVLPMDILTFLKNWIRTHIMKTDRLYAPFLNERGIH